MMLRGLISAAFTPMTSRGALNLKAIDRLAEMLVDNAVNGVFVNGTTGEFASLTIEERLNVARRWTKVAGGNLKVIVQRWPALPKAVQSGIVAMVTAIE